MPRRAKIPLCLTLVLLMALAVAGQSLAKPAFPSRHWIIEEVDAVSSCFAMQISLALASDGTPHISYYDSDEEVLMHARRPASGWQREVADGSEHVGRSSGIALDSLDRPHIAYRDLKHNTLKYARRDDSQWDVQSLGTGEYGWDPSIVIDSSDRPHISYLGYHPTVNGGQSPKYTHWNGSAWVVSFIEPVFSSAGIPIALDSGEVPHVSYAGAGSLTHAVLRGSVWLTETVDSQALAGHQVGLYSSLALDDEDNAHISYSLYGQDFSPPWPEDLRYARSKEGKWEYAVPDYRGYLGFYTSLALDSDGHPHISYQDQGRGALKHVYWDGADWIVSIVEQPAGIGGATSLALDQEDNVHIAYCEGAGQAIKYARGVILDQRVLLPVMAR